MNRIPVLLIIAAWLLPGVALAEPEPARGMLLVASESVSGDFFNQTVILILQYDERGAMGLVLNRPTEMESEEFLAHAGVESAYEGPLYWGGPVMMNMLNGLVRSDIAPDGGQPIVDSIYYLHAEEALDYEPGDAESLRLFLGYAGWGAGQLDYEMARGSWQVVPASIETVFAEDAEALWKKLAVQREYRAAL